ncbi:unnamed protein product [Staurois parvus]|uniref:Homeo box C6a n=1 Tax=Staurois parvus TaxID=386267 RepID=A0ABN9CCA4_9NEOB|nr:unnamed protein product [Staurois parvus]
MVGSMYRREEYGGMTVMGMYRRGVGGGMTVMGMYRRGVRRYDSDGYVQERSVEV